MTIHKIIAAIRSNAWVRLLSPSKKSGYKVPRQPLTSGYGKRKFDYSHWIALIRKKLSFPSFLRKRKSHLSRAEQRKIVRIKTTKTFCSLVIILVVLLGLKKPIENFATSLELFQINNIDISGCQITRPVEIKTLADFDYNTSIFDVSPDEIRLLLIKHPWIKDVKVERQWPNSIKILVKEHSIKALLVMGPSNEERFYYINRLGEPIAPVQVGQDIDYPVITGSYMLPGKEKDVLSQDAMEFLGLIARNDPNLPAQSVSEIHLDKTHGMVVHLVEFPFPIYFGKGEVKSKYKKLLKLLAVLYKKQKGNVDIGEVKYIRMDYLEQKVLVAKTGAG